VGGQVILPGEHFIDMRPHARGTVLESGQWAVGGGRWWFVHHPRANVKRRDMGHGT